MYSSEVDHNWAAFALAIIKPISPELAFRVIEEGPAVIRSLEGRDAINEEMLQLKRSGLTWEQVGAVFGVSDSAAYRRVKRYLAKYPEEVAQ